jgi:hypothetical protein
MIKTSKLLEVGALLCAGAVFAAHANDVDDVKTASAYSWGLVGTPSTQSSAEKAARVLFKNASDEVIYEVANNATLEGKMYVLCLMKRRGSSFYAQVKNSIDVKNSQVTVFSGSVLSKAPTEVIIGQIEKFNCDHLAVGK